MGIVTRPLDTHSRLTAASRLKVHLRLMRIRGTTYRVVTLRPGTRVAFSTNFFHQTWHIVTDERGARLLARLFWGLAFQHQPGTLVLVHGDYLLPTPFEAERSDPFLIVPTGITGIDAAGLRCLKSRLAHLEPPTTTIRWQTFGLDVALTQQQAGRVGLHRDENRHLWHQERMSRLGGFIVYQAPPAILRSQALRIHRLHVPPSDDLYAMDYHFLAETSSKNSWFGGGEVQIFCDYEDRVAAATEARHEFLANPRQPVLSEDMQEIISRRRDQIKARRKANVRARTQAVAE
jgi:hypothetical protein